MKSILIIEDDESILQGLVTIFHMENFPIHVARNGREALGVLKSLQELPGFICLDLMMPEMDGETFLKHLQTMDEWKDYRHIPVVLMSAARMNVKGNIAGQIKKPPEVEELLNFAEKYCRT